VCRTVSTALALNGPVPESVTSHPRIGPSRARVDPSTGQRCLLTFSTNNGSLESFQCSTRCGCEANARQIHETDAWFRPVAAAICRVDQCVPPSGGAVSSILTITSSTCWSLIFRGCPGRGLSGIPQTSTKLTTHDTRVTLFPLLEAPASLASLSTTSPASDQSIPDSHRASHRHRHRQTSSTPIAGMGQNPLYRYDKHCRDARCCYDLKSEQPARPTRHFSGPPDSAGQILPILFNVTHIPTPHQTRRP